MSSEQGKSIITEELMEYFNLFLQDHSPERISRSLRKVFLDYMRQQTAGLDVKFDAILDDMEALFDLLDVCLDGTKEWKNKRQNAS